MIKGTILERARGFYRFIHNNSLHEYVSGGLAQMIFTEIDTRILHLFIIILNINVSTRI